MSQGTALNNAILDFTVGKANSVAAGTGVNRLLRAYTVLPQADGSPGVDPPGDGPPEASINVVSNFTGSTASAGQISNHTEIIFPTATEDWGSIVGVALWRGSVLLRRFQAGAPITINSGDTLTIPAGSLILAVT